MRAKLVYYHLDRTQHGVDADARVVFGQLHAQRQRRPLPIQWHGNMPDRVPRVKSILIPIEIVPPPALTTVVSVFVAWVPANLDAEPWAEFLRALEALVEADYDMAIVPASAAVEAAVWQPVHAVTDPYVGGKRLEEFETQMPFGDLVNVLIPAFAGVLAEPQMADQLRGRVNRLRTLRNELAHRGPSTRMSPNTARFDPGRDRSV